MSLRQRITTTPLYDAWRARLAAALDARGAKSHLARHMAGLRDQSFDAWKVSISRVLNAGVILNAEDLLAITAWMESRATTPRRTAATATTRRRTARPDA